MTGTSSAAMTEALPLDHDPGADFYVYGIVSADAVLPAGLVGVDGRDVESVRSGRFAAAVTTAPTLRQIGMRDDLLAHSRVVNELARTAAVIPVRFGTVLPRAHIAEELLDRNAARVGALLDELTGRVQFTLRGHYDEEAVLAEIVVENSAIADLRARTRDQPSDTAHHERLRLGELVAGALDSKRADDGSRVLDIVSSHAVAHRVRRGGGLDHLLNVAFLVDSEDRAAFEQAAETAAEGLAGRATLKLLGPVAPYDFVDAE